MAADGPVSVRAADVSPTKVVLFVEDDPAIRLLCRATLERAPVGQAPIARVVVAPDLQTARRLVATEQPDVVVLDVRLPDGNGLDLARELGARSDSARPKVIIASASVLPAERTEALAAGAETFLAKPYRPSELLETIERLL